MREVLGLLSGILPIVGVFPYIRDILKHKTKPHRGSFLIWAVLDATAFSAQLAKGATWSTIMPAVGTIEVLTTFILSLKYGVGGFSKKDIGALMLAAIGLMLWYFTKQPLTAIIIVVGIDLIGTTLTALKTYTNPHTETFLTWLLSCVAGFFAAAAVGHWSFSLQIYPTCVGLGNGIICLAILFGRNKTTREARGSITPA